MWHAQVRAIHDLLMPNLYTMCLCVLLMRSVLFCRAQLRGFVRHRRARVLLLPGERRRVHQLREEHLLAGRQGLQGTPSLSITRTALLKLFYKDIYSSLESGQSYKQLGDIL